MAEVELVVADRIVRQLRAIGDGLAWHAARFHRQVFAVTAHESKTTKDYGYDVYGHRATETVTPNGQAATTYTYAYNVHDSVSLLLDPSGNTKSSYAYRPYGDQDATLSGGDPDKNDPFNAYRYAAKRFDSGSQTIDTGARRFATDTSKFLQPDQFNNALANLALGTDPLTQNRYSLAGGNPLSYQGI